MAKTILGIDVGHDQLKLALVRGGRVLKTAVAQMPENLLRQGRITSVESMGELIRITMKQRGIHANHAALVLPTEAVYVKNVEVPPMTVEQLEYNLPFEFKDYITGELKEYVFDYAVVSQPGEARPAGGSEEGGQAIELMAVGTLRAVLDDARDALRKAGLKLTVCAPAMSAYINLLRARHAALSADSEEYGILDMGYSAIRMYMFQKDRHVATRVLETGLSTLDSVIADAYGVDVHLARTYLNSNFENCQNREECRAAYENIAVELMRVLNFYRFSNPDSALADLWLCGGGAVNRPLCDAIGEMLNVQLHPATELVPGGEGVEACNAMVQAVGIAMS